MLSRLDSILQSRPPEQASLLPILHAVQDEFGHIPAGAVAVIARRLNLSRAEVHGVITYYHHFRQEPHGKHVVRVCCAEACQANGAEALAAHAQARQGDLTVEPVYCLGLCAIGPAVLVDDEHLHARVTPEKFDALIAALEAKP
jgi:formate dehydrogenase subunit gamma